MRLVDSGLVERLTDRRSSCNRGCAALAFLPTTVLQAFAIKELVRLPSLPTKDHEEIYRRPDARYRLNQLFTLSVWSCAFLPMMLFSKGFPSAALVAMMCTVYSGLQKVGILTTPFTVSVEEMSD